MYLNLFIIFWIHKQVPQTLEVFALEAGLKTSHLRLMKVLYVEVLTELNLHHLLQTKGTFIADSVWWPKTHSEHQEVEY